MEIKYSGFVSLAGMPNVGKSTLLNSLMGRKIAIVSPRPQTTRSRVVGIRTEGERQIVFIDTPGLHIPRTALGDVMVRTANENIGDTDIVVLVTTVKREPSTIEKRIIEGLEKSGQKSILVINKVDLVKDKPRIMETIAAFAGVHEFDAVVPLCARTGKGVDILEKELYRLLPEGVQYYPEDMVTETPEQIYCGELIRERLLMSLSEEVPHGIAVDVYRIERRSGGLYDIDVSIICEKQGHKAIIIGKNGDKLKSIASAARQELEEHFGAKVNLQCWVKVKDDWRDDVRTLRSLGYE